MTRRGVAPQRGGLRDQVLFIAASVAGAIALAAAAFTMVVTPWA